VMRFVAKQNRSLAQAGLHLLCHYAILCIAK